MSEAPRVPRFVNQAMQTILRSPLHGMVSSTVLLITFTGRKSGNIYTTPVDYSQDGDQVTIFTHADWWKNLCSGSPVTLRMRGRERQGLPETVAEDKQVVAAGLMEHLRKVPGDAKYYGVTFDGTGSPKAGEVEKAARTVVMVRIRLC